MFYGSWFAIFDYSAFSINSIGTLGTLKMSTSSELLVCGWFLSSCFHPSVKDYCTDNTSTSFLSCSFTVKYCRRQLKVYACLGIFLDFFQYWSRFWAYVANVFLKKWDWNFHVKWSKISPLPPLMFLILQTKSLWICREERMLTYIIDKKVFINSFMRFLFNVVYERGKNS